MITSELSHTEGTMPNNLILKLSIKIFIKNTWKFWTDNTALAQELIFNHLFETNSNSFQQIHTNSWLHNIYMSVKCIVLLNKANEQSNFISQALSLYEITNEIHQRCYKLI